jgi:hypothetical protein
MGGTLSSVALTDRLDAALLPFAADLDPALLHAVAGAVLPTELGTDGARRAADEFAAWVAGYRAGAELLHDYGNPTLAYSGPSPMRRWAAQLTELDQVARRRSDSPFASLAVAQRRALVAERVAADRPKGDLPADPSKAAHVAVGLLAHFYAQPDATDLCYGAEIGPTRCRPLSKNPERPAPLRRRTA